MPRCLNCANEINYGARVCPHCHLSPYNPFATDPYPAPPEADIDPLTVGVLGGLLLPVLPVVGGLLLGGSVLCGLRKKVKG
jgi:hypothetical protein